jgi:hypothetical protein
MSLVFFLKIQLNRIQAGKRKSKQLKEFSKLGNRHLEDIGLFEFERKELIQQSWG